MTPHRCATVELSPEILGEALEGRVFRAFYQPRIACASRSLVGFEVLARWPHPDLGMIMPDQFVPIAERAGRIGQLARQVIEDALSWFAEPFRDTTITIAVNLSATLLADPQLPGWLTQCCSRFGIDPHQVILAIPEIDAISSQITIASIAMRLRLHGFPFCISNFGVGYSSLLQLAQLPFSALKIDKRFVRQASVSETSREVISSVIGLSRAVDLHVTADGAEDDWTLDFLTRKGCDAAMGLLIAPPMDGPTTLAWRETHGGGRGATGP